MKNAQQVRDILCDPGTKITQDAFDYMAEMSPSISTGDLRTLFQMVYARASYNDVVAITKAVALAFPSEKLLLAQYIGTNFPASESFKIGLTIGLLELGEVGEDQAVEEVRAFDEALSHCLVVAVQTGGSSLLNSEMVGRLSNAVGSYMAYSERSWFYGRFVMIRGFLKIVAQDKGLFRAQTLRMVLVEKIAVKYFTTLPFEEKLHVLASARRPTPL